MTTRPQTARDRIAGRDAQGRTSETMIFILSPFSTQGREENTHHARAFGRDNQN